VDEIDRAQEREQIDRELALNAARARVAASFEPRDASVDGRCIDCGNAIEPGRLAALQGCCSRCIECAQRNEQVLRGRAP
jgi:RNA polymerase-binding transcription factor DksA